MSPKELDDETSLPEATITAATTTPTGRPIRIGFTTKPDDWHRGMGTVSFNKAYGDKPYRTRHTKEGKATYRYFADELSAWEYLRGQASPSTEDITVDQLLTLWISSSAVTKLAPATQESYKYVAKLYLEPGFRGVPVKALTPQRAQTFLDHVKLVTKKKQRPSNPYLHRMREYLSTCLNWGKTRGYVEKNVIESGIDLERLSTDDFVAWNRSEVSRFFKVLDKEDSITNAYYRLLVTTSIRRGEGRGIRWADISEDGQWLAVRGQLQELHGMKYRDTKAHKVRMVQLDQTVQKLFVKIPHVGPYVFTNSNGRPLTNKWIAQTMTRLTTAAGNPQMGVHGLRHTHATLLAEDGAGVAEIADALGCTLQIAQRYVKRGSRNKAIAQRQQRLFGGAA